MQNPAPESPNRRSQAAMATIRLARRMFSHTKVHSWPITGYLYRKVFAVAADGGERTSPFRGIQLTFPTEDVAIAPGLISGYYEEQELALFERLARFSRIIVDAGGNIGIYACAGAMHLPPDGQLVSFEPVPDNVTRLRQNLAQNALRGQVTVEPLALGAASGELTLHLAEGLTGAHSVAANPDLASRGVITVPVTTVDDYLAEHELGPVDILKIDVEGYDLAVLRGALKTIQDDGPTLFVEYAPALLRNAGFDPAELLDLVFEHYEHVLAIDEPRKLVWRATRAELTAMADRKNLINLACVRNKEHLALLDPALLKR